MRFEVDLIRYVIDLAIARRVFIRSKDLNADWLPFNTILEVFSHISRKLGLSKEVESRCYKALLKMSSSHERHLTWAYKVQHIEKYLPAKTSTHAAKHTTSSWTRHLIPHETPSPNTDKARTPRQSIGLEQFNELGLNLGRLSERGLFADYSPSAPFDSGRTHDNSELRRMLRELAREQELFRYSKNGGSAETPSAVHSSPPDSQPRPPPTATGSPSCVHPPPAAPEAMSTPYFKHYVPTARWTSQGIPISPIPMPPTTTPIADGRATTSAASTGAQNQTTPPPTGASYTPSRSKINTNGGPFADEELLAMHARVAAIEAEARRTRELLANIAYLKETSTGARLDYEGTEYLPPATGVHEEQRGVFDASVDSTAMSQAGLRLGPSPPSTSPSSLQQPQQQIYYGQIPLSPYLNKVLHLPPGVVSMDASAGEQAASAPQHREPVRTAAAVSPVPQHFTFEPTIGTPLKSGGTLRSPSVRYGSSGGAAEPAEGTRSTFASPASTVKRSPVASSPHLSAQKIEPGWTASPSNKTRKSEKHEDLSNSLRCSAAMKKYLELTSHRTVGLTAAPEPAAAGASVNSNTFGTSPSQSGHRQNFMRSVALMSEVVSPKGKQSPRYSPRSPGPHLTPVRTTGSEVSPSQRYQNSCRTRHTQETDVTTIESRIDELLGDSLNIEEKDGRVYVHFQSKFLLEEP